MEFTIRFAKAAKRSSMGSAATSVAAIRPAQSVPVFGDCARNTASATVSTREESV